MIQKLCLLRKKEDDILVIFLLEFFKLIGFIVRDVVVDHPDSVKEWKGEYDKAIILNYDLDDVLLKFSTWEQKVKQKISVTIPNLPSDMDSVNKNGKVALLETIIPGIWKDSDEQEQIKQIASAYTESSLFYYLYNKGNLKFVEEYYPLSDEEYNVEQSRQQAFEKTLHAFQKCHDILENNVEQCGSPYYRFARVKLRYKINDMRDIQGSGYLYSTEYMLEQLQTIIKEEPEFIRAYYLYGHICAGERKTLWAAQEYYEKAIRILDESDPENLDRNFLYYQMGRYFEKKRKRIEQAVFCYEQAHACEPKEFRTLFKLAVAAKNEGAYRKAVDICNEIIRIILNGYVMKKLMPKEQIYVYKCFRLMGDTFYIQEQYDLAATCYRNVLSLIRTENEFYEKLHLYAGENYRCFEEVLKACMPKKPILSKLTRCASWYDDASMLPDE